ncbi:O-methyltransferase [Colletotrichum orbiculare MAFF 240422]|uniref:O-methyltransferase n=1 Tax=Colletotrichum orbiculare (strain 104-T / ATCC 96160 / CBS 514.97 / LARS 414 / MAFF 240422) TaxID=1213857 RepID=A0A484FAH1_COLOR|nr:O-methyltransferase [Colletotrichum orbiculare MAFF 240422]
MHPSQVDEKSPAPGNGKSVLQSFIGSIENVSSDDFANERDRASALRAAQTLLVRIESPWDTIVRLNMTQPALSAVLKTLKDLKFFEKWQAAGNGALTTGQAVELLEEEYDATLLYRFLRLLAANYIVEEITIGTFIPTNLGIALTAPIFDSLIKNYHGFMAPIYSKLPEYFADTDYRNPQDPACAGFQYAHKWNGNLWSYYDAHRAEQDDFNII